MSSARRPAEHRLQEPLPTGCRRPWTRHISWCAALFLAALPACGGDGEDPAEPLVGDIEPAVESLEEQLGGPQQYFEINADPRKVTLWVATGDATMAEPFVYAGGEIAEPSEPQTATGPTFGADELSFEADDVLDQVRSDLEDSEIAQFSIQHPADEIEYLVVVQSEFGGRLEIRVDSDGDVLEASDETPTS